MFNELEKEPEPSDSEAEEIISICYKREIARQIAQSALEIGNGKDASFETIRTILGNYEQAKVFENQGPIAVSDEIGPLLLESQNDTKWKFNISTISEALGGVGPGTFIEIAARPELGKSAFWISICCAPGGFEWQGAKVLGLGNEEQASKLKVRSIMAETGLTKAQIQQDQVAAGKKREVVKGRLIVYDIVGMHLDQISELIKKEKPDIVVIDQLDKVKISGEFARGDERLRELYNQTREIAKVNQVAIFAISQIGAQGHGKLYPDYSTLENSKTGKAAEADLILCLGANELMKNERGLSIQKNKITGIHNNYVIRLLPEISTYVE